MSKTTIPAGGITDGTLTSAKLDQDGAFTFNEDSGNVDFRVESNGNTHMLMVDGSGDRVGIGEDVPEATLHVMTSDAGVGPNANGDDFVVENNDNCGISILSANNGYGSIMFGDNGDDDIGQIRYNHSNNSMAFITQANQGIFQNNSGNVGIKTETVGSVLVVNGSFSKSSGSFLIDHPLNSMKDTHNLYHSFVESPQANNIYRGKVDLVGGSATVNLDTVSTMTSGTFAALNREIHCYTSNESSWDAVKGSVSGNVLTISCQNSSSTATVSWLVIGERQDQHMYDTEWTDDNGKVIVEREKE